MAPARLRERMMTQRRRLLDTLGGLVEDRHRFIHIKVDNNAHTHHHRHHGHSSRLSFSNVTAARRCWWTSHHTEP